MMESPFQRVGANHVLAAAAFRAWTSLIDSFQLAGQLINPKRVALVVKPIYHPILLNPHTLVLQV